MSAIYDWNLPISSDQSPATVFVITAVERTGSTIAAALSAEGYETIVYDSAEDFLAANPSVRPCCVIAEVDLPGISGADLHERLSLRSDDLPTILIADEGTISEATAAIRAGVIDYMIKPFKTSTLIDRVAEAVSISRKAVLRSNAALRLSALTRREKEILGYLTEGCPVSEIARSLNLSPKTIQAHRSNIMEKTETLSVVELTRLCLYAKPELIGINGMASQRRRRTAPAHRLQGGAGQAADIQHRLGHTMIENRPSSRVNTPN